MLRVVVLKAQHSNTSENGEHILHSLDSEYKSNTKLMTILGPLVDASLGHSFSGCCNLKIIPSMINI